MKILMLDIETAPHRVYTWGLWQQNVALNQIEEVGYTLCWAAKWYGDDKVMYSSIHRDGKVAMLWKMYTLLEEADVVVHYYGSHFDVPTLNQEFLAMGWTPPAPFIELDLINTVRKRFKLPSNKLNYISNYLGLGEKINHKGMELWRGCMEGNPEDWKVMEQYNKQDVVLLEKLYDVIRPWIKNHPNHALFTDDEMEVCPNCGSDHLQKRGFHYTKTLTYQRVKCMDCGAWSRYRTTNMPKEKRKGVLVGVA